MNENIKIFFSYAVLFIFFYAMISSCSNIKTNEREENPFAESARIYRENHKNEGNGYHGLRRNSWAESMELKSDGFDPDEYRTKHGY